MFVRKYPRIFDLPDIDFMARGWNMDPRASHKLEESIMVDPYFFDTSGGIMFFSQSSASKDLVSKWIEKSANPAQIGKADDRILSLVVNSYKMILSMKMIQLPVEYLWLTIDFDERMLESQYNYDTVAMRDSIIIEHAECLTSEDTASGSGASSDRGAKFAYKDDYYPISEFLHAYIMFPTEEFSNSFKTYYDYLDTLQYKPENDMMDYLLENDMADEDNPENNARPFYVVRYKNRFGDIPHSHQRKMTYNQVAIRNMNYVKRIDPSLSQKMIIPEETKKYQKMVKSAKKKSSSNDNLMDFSNTSNRSRSSSVSDGLSSSAPTRKNSSRESGPGSRSRSSQRKMKKLVEITGKSETDGKVIPEILVNLLNGHPVLFVPHANDTDPFYDKVKSNLSEYAEYDFVFHDARTGEMPLNLYFKPQMDLTTCVLFMPGSTVLIKLLLMHTCLQEIADLLKKGAYQFVSLLRIKYLMHDSNTFSKIQKGKIPRKIHQIWIGKEMPRLLRRWCNQWKDTKGYKYKLWGNADITKGKFPLTYEKLKEILDKENPVYAMAADLMRLEILYHHGGLYIDTTMEKLKHPDELINQPGYEFLISNEISDPDMNLDYVSNSFIASQPKHIVLRRLLDKDMINSIDLAKPANKVTGPFYLRRGIADGNEVTYIDRNLVYPLASNYQDDEGNSVEDKCVKYEEEEGFTYEEYFDKEFYVKDTCDEYPDSYMIKHWDIGGTWR